MWPGWNPGINAIFAFSLLLVLSFAPRGFFCVPTFLNADSTIESMIDEEPLCGFATSKSLYIYLFTEIGCIYFALHPNGKHQISLTQGCH